jgi:hypothetical protein
MHIYPTRLMHYALCCVPWWFRGNSNAIINLCDISLCIIKKSTVYQFPYTKNCIVVVSSHAMRRSMLKLTCLRKKNCRLSSPPHHGRQSDPCIQCYRPSRISRPQPTSLQQRRSLSRETGRVEHKKNASILSTTGIALSGKLGDLVDLTSFRSYLRIITCFQDTSTDSCGWKTLCLLRI